MHWKLKFSHLFFQCHKTRSLSRNRVLAWQLLTAKLDLLYNGKDSTIAQEVAKKKKLKANYARKRRMKEMAHKTDESCSTTERWGLPPPQGGTPLYLLYRDLPLDRVWFSEIPVLNRIYNSYNSCVCVLNRVFIAWTSGRVLLSRVAWACARQNIKYMSEHGIIFKALYWYLRSSLEQGPKSKWIFLNRGLPIHVNSDVLHFCPCHNYTVESWIQHSRQHWYRELLSKEMILDVWIWHYNFIS